VAPAWTAPYHRGPQGLRPAHAARARGTTTRVIATRAMDAGTGATRAAWSSATVVGARGAATTGSHLEDAIGRLAAIELDRIARVQPHRARSRRHSADRHLHSCNVDGCRARLVLNRADTSHRRGLDLSFSGLWFESLGGVRPRLIASGRAGTLAHNHARARRRMQGPLQGSSRCPAGSSPRLPRHRLCCVSRQYSL
jgi:hypothetical protein